MMKFTSALLVASAILIASSLVSAQADPCNALLDCEDCISSPSGCGWCSYPNIYANGEAGPQCAGTTAGSPPFTCPAIFSRFQCQQGWVCNPATAQCQLGAPGTGTNQAACEQTCSSNTPVPAAKVYVCDQATKTCNVAPSGTPGSAALPICEAQCLNISTAAPGPVQQTYICNLTTFTCDPTTPGHGSSEEVCELQCNKEDVGYECNTTTAQCFMVQPPAGSNQAACQAACGNSSNTPLPTLPPAPGPPPEYVGTWRGVEIQNNYEIVEWDLKINHTTVVIVRNLKSGREVQSGIPFHIRNSAVLQFWILITAGPNIGHYIRTIGDATGEKGPSTTFVTMAMAPAGGLTPTSIDDAMTNGVDRVLALSACIVGDQFCFFSLPSGVSSGDDAEMLIVPRTAEEKIAAAREARVQKAMGAAEAKSLRHKQLQQFRHPQEQQQQRLGFNDNCSAFSLTCQSCIASPSGSCGWCSVDVVYSNGQKGTQCSGTAPGTTPFICQGSYSTDSCEVGYMCESGSFKCIVAQPGDGAPLAQCLATCKKTPPPNPLVPQYTCNLATHQCQLCTAAHCPGSMPKGQCESLCAHPRPAPTPDMIGVWRGIYIQQGYAFGEIDLVLNMTGAFFYVNGVQYFTAGVVSLGADIMIWTVQTGPAALVGKSMSVLYQMANVDRKMYWQGTFAISVPDGQFPSGFNRAMYTKKMSELVLTKCLNAPCKFHSP